MENLNLTILANFLSSVSTFFRKRRMQLFLRFLDQTGVESPKILDVGGSPYFWEEVDRNLSLTILNLPGNLEKGESRHEVSYVEGDGCEMHMFGNNQFDIVFSNSVIEHVGDEGRQKQFSDEIKRVGKFFWVQTPSKYFPVEAHSGMLFWWFYPTSLRMFFIDRWKRKVPDWADMVENTLVISRRFLEEQFPKGQITVERFLGIPKSYIIKTRSVHGR
jgi:hypothetical protein